MTTLELIYEKAQTLDARRLEALYAFIQFLTGKEAKGEGRRKYFPLTQLESPSQASVYRGKPLSLADMDAAIDFEAGAHKLTLGSI